MCIRDRHKTIFPRNNVVPRPSHRQAHVKQSPKQDQLFCANYECGYSFQNESRQEPPTMLDSQPKVPVVDRYAWQCLHGDKHP